MASRLTYNNDRSETEKDSELVVTVYSSKDYLILAATPSTGTGTYTIEVEEVTTSMGQRANSPATGGPGITGMVQAGETLTATTDGIEDEDGLTGAVFAYQWVRSGADIEGAASSTYTVTGDDEGKPIQVRVTFTDDAGNAESLTSYAKLSAPPLIIPDEEPPPESTEKREAREAQGEQEAAETPLTAAIHDAPESHDGQEDFTFELRFSEEPTEGFSSLTLTLRDHAFTVTGGDGGRGPAAGRRQRHPRHPLGDQRHPGLQRGRHRRAARSPRIAMRRGQSAPRTGRCCPAR